MNECLTIDDDDEENHRRFFSCPDSLQCAGKGIQVNGQAKYLFFSCSDYLPVGFEKKHHIITLISGNCDHYGLITG
jgi:hypothetical protein